jgi:hypothetical protein
MDKDFLMILTFLLALISINVYVNESGVPKHTMEGEFLHFWREIDNPSTNSKPEDENKSSKVDIEILEVKETALFSREIRARVKNNVDDLTSVRIRVDLIAGNERVKINGKDSLVLHVGDLKRGKSVEITVEVSIDFFDGIKITEKGYVDAILTVLYDGGSETKSYRLKLMGK